MTQHNTDQYNQVIKVNTGIKNSALHTISHFVSQTSLITLAINWEKEVLRFKNIFITDFVKSKMKVW
jgi:hypothetical protein